MMISLIIILIIIILIPSMIKEQQTQKERKLSISNNSILAADFIYKKYNLIKEGYNTKGIYIFTNITKNNCKYVGQSIHLINRVSNHLKGRGNPDMYNDILIGDEFTIELIKLKDTEFYNLDGLESYYIAKYNTYHNGYNKTRGNHTK